MTDKLVLLTLLSFAILTWSDMKAEAVVPGYQRVEASIISPLDAQKILDGRRPQGIILSDRGILSSTEATPEIQELARGLKNDPDLIYEYVYNGIEYTPIFGCIKGANATLLDGKGNDFDQSSLLIALLRQAGYTANFVYGVIRLTPEQITNWLGVENNISAIGNLLGSAGIPGQTWTYPDDTLAFVDMAHVWVKVTISGSDYVFDPSFKTHSYKQAIDLASAMSYNQSSFLSNALSGTTIDPDYIQKINKSNIRNDLTTYATNLITHIKANYSSAYLNNIIGGKTINPLAGFPRQTSLSYQQSITEEWTDIPNQYKTSLRIQHLGIDETLYSCDIYGKRLTIFYNTFNQPVLRLNGAIIATGFATTLGTYQNITFTVDHPYAANGSTYCDATQTLQIKAGGSYLVVNGWSEINRGIVEHHRKLLKENIHAGGENTSEQVLGEALAMIGYTWLAECNRANELSDQLSKVFTIHHHTLGIAGQNESPYIDMPMCLASSVSREGDSFKARASFFSNSGHSSAFEWGVIDQLQPHSAVSTVKLIDISNDKLDKIFDVTSSNYYSSIKPQLINYNPSELSLIEAYINAGYRVILPQDGDLKEKDWKGIGFLTISPSENQIGHIISGGLSGGFGNTTWDLSDLLSDIDIVYYDIMREHAQSSEPIDLVTGDYLYEKTALTVGNGGYPFSLEFKHSYNSGSRLDDGPLGLGWTHNFDNSAIVDSDGFQGLGEDSAIDAATAIVECYVSINILQGSKTKECLGIATLAHRWFMDQLIDNIVTVREPGNTSKFVKLPDGKYNPPPGVASILSKKADNSYLLKTKHGILLDFNTEGKIATWQDTNNNKAIFTYGGGKLQSVSNGLGRGLTFTYNGDHINKVSDGTGRNVEYVYDGAGNLITVTDCNGNNTTFEYDINKKLTKIYYPSHPANPFVINTYDTLDRVKTQTNASGNTYQYYFTGFRAEEKNPLGNSHIWYFNNQGKTIQEIDSLGNKISSVYDGHNRLILLTYPEKNSIAYEYDGNHNLTKETLNPKPGSSALPIIKLYAYEPTFNRVKASTDARGHTTTFDYDLKGNITSIKYPEIDGYTPTTIFTYNSRGQIESTTDPEGMITGYVYDSVTGDILSVTVDKGRLNLTMQMSYDAVGNLIGKTNPRGHITSFQYDNMRQLKQIIAPTSLNYVTKYTYDPNGGITKVERETGDVLNPWQTSAISYTLTGKKEAVTDSEGNITIYQYDQIDKLKKVIDAKNHTTEYLYDANSRFYRIIDAQGNISEEYTYTSNSKKQSIKDAKGNTTQYEYDDFLRLHKTVYPDGSYEESTYDTANNLTKRRTRAGEFISYTYDPLNRLKTKTIPGLSITYSYDLVGRLKDVTDPNGTIHYVYDTAGRLKSVTYPDAKTISYEYDDVGNRTKLTYPDGYFVTYTYDELNRLTKVLEEGTGILAQYTYDSLSRRITLNYGNNTSSRYTYEMDNDLTSLQHQFSGSTITFGYNYDALGNRRDFTSSDDRFIFSPPVNIHVNYVSNNLNQYNSVGGISFTYDGNGNLTSDGINSYTYDAENRLTGAITPSHTATYTYDPFGKRKRKTVDNGLLTIDYFHDGDQVIVEYSGSGQMLRRYVYGQGIDEPISMATTSARYYYHFDGLGSVIVLSDNAGNIVETYSYSPYGEVNQASSIGNPYLYTGREYDPETGLYYYRARYYSPTLGHFLQADPIGYAGGMNLYAYVSNNPVNLIDPWGLCKEYKEYIEGEIEPFPWWQEVGILTAGILAVKYLGLGALAVTAAVTATPAMKRLIAQQIIGWYILIMSHVAPIGPGVGTAIKELFHFNNAAKIVEYMNQLNNAMKIVGSLVGKR